MESQINTELIKNDHRYKLHIKSEATNKEYAIVLNFLIRELQLKEVKEVNDYDSCYHLFDYKGFKVVISYSNFLGINMFLFDTNVSSGDQVKVLKELSEVVAKVVL